MGNRDFSDAVKLEVIKNNLGSNNDEIHCEVCGKKLSSISECHFDHIAPYAKGGKSILSNCQILCIACNLRKNDKELKDFVLEERAKRFLTGDSLYDVNNGSVGETPEKSQKMTKELFDKLIGDFINRKGNIYKVDFGREYNHLPSIHYVRQYYGDLNSLKKAFGVEDLSNNWNRETIKTALNDYVLANGSIVQKDLTKANGLPSMPCILNYYPEYKSFTDIKRGLCSLDVPDQWTRENAISAGKGFVAIHGKIVEKDLRAANHLPTSRVIYRLFGSLANYQEIIGAEISQKNDYISKQEIDRAVDSYFDGKERIIESQKVFFETFSYSPSTIWKRYGTFAEFCREYGIHVVNSKKAKYTKREVDDAISNWIKAGNKIPRAKDLSRLGLPSQSVILKFYEDWKDPFFLYEKIYEEIRRN